MPHKGRIHSFQSLGTIDGPGVRFVVFMQGCSLRCSCCHNPDTWQTDGGNEYSPQEVLSRVVRFRDYFGEKGGITVSGGEPLLQPQFVQELFALCRDVGINTCLDTSGSIMNGAVRALLCETDRVLLDIKYTDDALYRKYVGCALQPVLDFLGYLDSRQIPTTLRQVIIPTLNDTGDNIRALGQIAQAYSCVDKVELLPFRKICQLKYDNLGKNFPFADIPEPTAESMAALGQKLREYTEK